MKDGDDRERETKRFDVCPKCGAEHPHWTMAGKANSGKPMIRCSACHHRITIDYGQLTHYSHQNQSQWNQLIEDTDQMHTIDETAEKLGVSRMTVSRMRNRLLSRRNHS